MNLVNTAPMSLNETPTKLGGAYAFASGATGYTGFTANGIMGAMRWTSATSKAIITDFRVDIAISTLFTLAQIVGMYAKIVRGYTAPVTGTSIAITPSPKNVAYPASAFSSILQAGTATTGLTAGTNTPDSSPIFEFISPVSNVLGGVGLGAGRSLDLSGNKHIVLSQNEGIELYNTVLLGALGVVRVMWEVHWLEVPNGLYAGMFA